MVRVPLWQMIADQINAQFAIPEFGVEVAFDLSTVEALKPSVESQQTTAIAAFTAGVLTQDEARETFGLMPLGATPEVVTASRDKRVQTKRLQTKQYDDIDFNPPQAVREEAAQGLEWREEFGRGGTEVGVARGRDLSNGRIISPETARRMKAYFLRHEIDKEAEGWNDDENGYPSAGRIAWALWGGDPGFAWVDDIVTRMDSEDAEYEDGIDNDNDSEGGESSGLAPFRSDAVDDAVFFKAVDDISEKWAKRIARAFAEEAAKLEAELIGNVKTRGPVMTKQEGDPFDVEEWTARFLSATESEREGLVEEMVKAASSDVDAEDGEYGKARREGIDESSQKIASSIGTIREDVRFILNNSGGLSGEEIADLLRSKFAEIKSSRADAIGRTTATATTGKTQSAVWKTASDRESDPDRKIVRQWVSFPGARDAHSGANGQFEDLDTGFFTVGGEQTEYPAGPGLSAKNAVNCRCITRARRRADYDRLTTSPL